MWDRVWRLLWPKTHVGLNESLQRSADCAEEREVAQYLEHHDERLRKARNAVLKCWACWDTGDPACTRCGGTGRDPYRLPGACDLSD